VVFPSKFQLYEWSQGGLTTRWVGVQLTSVWGNLKNFDGVGSWYIDGGLLLKFGPKNPERSDTVVQIHQVPPDELSRVKF
jgi:hypothetical protein